MGFFQNLGRQEQRPTARDPMQMMKDLKARPSGFMKEAGYNVPESMSDPQQIVNHLMQTGQLPQNRLTRAMQIFNGMMRR